MSGRSRSPPATSPLTRPGLARLRLARLGLARPGVAWPGLALVGSRTRTAPPDQALGVASVDALQDVVWQAEPVDPPAAVLWEAAEPVVEALIARLEESVVEPVDAEVGAVGAEEDTIGKADQQVMRRIGLATKLGNAGADVDIEVGGLLEPRLEKAQVLPDAGEVGADDPRRGVAAKHGPELVDQLVVGRIAGMTGIPSRARRPVPPLRMEPQLLPPLVGPVQWLEERPGVRDVDQDGQADLRACLPHGVEA